MAESPRRLLVVLGVTGQQGGSVARVFVGEAGWRVRGVTRDPSKAASTALRDAGVEVVAGDLDDATSLDRAFAGADAIFSVTDFWQFVQAGSPIFAAAHREGRWPNELAMEREVQQGKNVVDAAARAHAAKPLHRFVLSTLSDASKWSGGKVKWNLHFDGKARYTDYLRAEHPELAARASYLQMGYYLSNLKTFGFSSPYVVAAADGAGEEEISLPAFFNGQPIPYVHPPNDTGHLVRALIESPSAPPGTTLLGYCERITKQELATAFSRVFGKRAKLEYLSLESLKTVGLPEWLLAEVTASDEYVSTYGWDGGEPGVKHPADIGVDMARLTKVEGWIANENWKGKL